MSSESLDDKTKTANQRFRAGSWRQTLTAESMSDEDPGASPLQGDVSTLKIVILDEIKIEGRWYSDIADSVSDFAGAVENESAAGATGTSRQ